MKKLKILLILLCISQSQLYAKSFQRNELIKAYLFHFIKNIEWSNENQISEFKILLFSDDENLIGEIKSLSNLEILDKKPIIVSIYNENVNINNYQLIFISREKLEEYKSIFSTIIGKNILLASDGYPDKQLTMINFFDTRENKLLFEINKDNIDLQKLSILPNLIIHGGTSIDVDALYKKSQKTISIKEKEITNLIRQLDSIKVQIVVTNNILKLQKEEIEFQTKNIEEQMTQIKNQKVLLDTLSIENFRQRTSITQSNGKLVEQEKQIAFGKMRLNEQRNLLCKQEDNIDQQKKILRYQGEVISNQQRYIVLIISSFVLTLLLSVALYISYIDKKKSNELLESQKQKLETALSELKMMQNKLKEAKEEAEEANRVKGKFLSLISHELKTPLNAILGYSRLLENNSKLDETLKPNIITISHAGQCLLELINDVSNFSKLETNKHEFQPTEFELPNLIIQLINMMSVKALEKNLIFEYTELSELPRFVYGDQRKLKQSVLNILSNAIKYTFEGKIIFRVSYVMQEETGALCCQIEDTGIGIRPEKLEYIFEPFTQVNDNSKFQEGVGLGLAITREFVDLMKGQITVASTYGKGSIFTLSIPLVQLFDKTSSSIDRDQTICGYEGEKRKILIIDDDFDNRSVIVNFLNSIKFELKTTDKREEIIELIEEFQPDLIVLDYFFAETNGYRVLQKVQELVTQRQIKILGTLAVDLKKEDIELVVKDCDEFITEPLEITEVLERIGKLLNITWKYSPQSILTTQNQTCIATHDTCYPSFDILEEIKKNAELGFFDDIEIILANLVNTNNIYSGFYDQIKIHLEVFNEEGIIKYIESILVRESLCEN